MMMLYVGYVIGLTAVHFGISDMNNKLHYKYFVHTVELSSSCQCRLFRSQKKLFNSPIILNAKKHFNRFHTPQQTEN